MSTTPVFGQTIPDDPTKWPKSLADAFFLALEAAGAPEIVNAKRNGGIEATIAALGANETSLLVSSAHSVANNLTIPRTLIVEQPGAGLLNVASGKLVTIAAALRSIPHQLFAGAGSMAFALDSPTPVIYPQQWDSLAGQAGHDCTAALQKFFAALSRSGGRGAHGCIPGGTYLLSDTIHITSTAGMLVQGGGFATTFSWAGAADRPMFLIEDADRCEIGNFIIAPTLANPLQTAIQTKNIGGGVQTPRQCIFRNIYVFASALHALGKGFVFGSGTDGNNDFHACENCFVFYPELAAYSLEASQVYNCLFVNCFGIGAAGATNCAGLASDLGAGLGGSFTWIGGSLSGNSGADFSLKNTQPSIIMGFDSENSARFIRTTGLGQQPCGLSVYNARWASIVPAADGRFINFASAGPLVLENLFVFAPTGNNLNVYLNKSGGVGYYRMSGLVMYRNTGVTIQNLFPLSMPDEARGLMILNYDTGALYGVGDVSPITPYTRHVVQVPAYAASFTPDPLVGDIIRMTLTGNTTVHAPVTTEKTVMTLVFIQDGTGGRTVTFDDAFAIAGSYLSNWTPNTGANKVNSITFQFNGGYWEQISSAVGLA